MPTCRGSTQHLARIVERPVNSIPDVVERLTEVYDHAVATTTAGENDGIACFTGLYRAITERVDGEAYEDRDFLVRLDLEFARRYFAALRGYATERDSAPRPWRLLFDARSDPDIERVQFAAAGVNAHINYDLADALLGAWVDFEPDEARHRDYRRVDDVFRVHLDGLRQRYGAPFGGAEHHQGIADRVSNLICGALVRGSRSEAWSDAMKVWTAPDRVHARHRMLDSQDAEASFLGRALLLPLG